MAKESRVDTHNGSVCLLKSIFGFLFASGADEDLVRTLVDRALVQARRPCAKKVTSTDSPLATAARVLDAWHRNPRYVDRSATPKAIRLLGRAPSVEALVRAEHSRCDALEFAKSMRKLGLLRRSGRCLYRPASNIAVVDGLNPLVEQHVVCASANLLRTIQKNISTPVRSSKLIERFAEVPDLPAKCVADFRKFSQEQGWALLKTLNDWLESRRVRRTSRNRGRTVRAGVHLYAYLDSSG